MISLRSLKHADVVCTKYELGPKEQRPGFIRALNDKNGYYILELGIWIKRKRKPHTEETKQKISSSMKTYKDHVK